MQPSYLNWKENDKKTAQFITAALNANNSKYIPDDIDLTNWIKKLHRDVSFNGQHHFTRQAQRDMSDGSRIQFFWNKTNQWQTLSLILDKKYTTSYWMMQLMERSQTTPVRPLLIKCHLMVLS